MGQNPSHKGILQQARGPQGLKPLKLPDLLARLPFAYAQGEKPCHDENYLWDRF
jgi:hypothetical protein